MTECHESVFASRCIAYTLLVMNHEVTQILNAIDHGDPRSSEAFFPQPEVASGEPQCLMHNRGMEYGACIKIVTSSMFFEERGDCNAVGKEFQHSKDVSVQPCRIWA